MDRFLFPVADDATYRLPGAAFTFGARSGEIRHLDLDDNAASYLRHKAALALTLPGSYRTGPADNPAELQAAAWLRDIIAAELSSLSHGEPLPATLDELLPMIQEDLVIMQRDRGEAESSARAVYLHVSFPSGWCPACALGETFAAIHAPVPRVDNFTDAKRNAHAANLFGSRTRARYVWTVTADDRIDRRACAAAQPHFPRIDNDWTAVDSAASIFLRVERQIIVPMQRSGDSETAVFLIRVHQRSAMSLTALQRHALANSIDSMHDDIAQYKGLLAQRARIVRLLRQ